MENIIHQLVSKHVKSYHAWEQLASDDHRLHGWVLGPAFDELDIAIPGAVVGPSGDGLDAQAFNLLTADGTKVKDILTLTWVSSGHTAWSLRHLTYPCPSNAVARQIELLIVSLCASFPQLLIRPLLPKQLMAEPDGEHCVEIVHGDDTWFIQRTALSTDVVERKEIKHVASFRTASRAWFQEDRRFCSHPAVATTLQLYSGHHARHVTFKLAWAAALPAAAPQSSPKPTAARTVRAALKRLRWKRLHQDPSVSASEAQTFHRFKAGQWPRWDHATRTTRCQCTESLADPYHQEWLCSKAQTAWAILKQTWGAMVAISDADWWTDAIFTLQLPSRVVKELLARCPTFDGLCTQQVRAHLLALWKADVHVILTHIWRRHWGDSDQRTHCSRNAANAGLRPSTRSITSASHAAHTSRSGAATVPASAAPPAKTFATTSRRPPKLIHTNF